MFKKILVGEVVAEGKLLLDALARNRFPVAASFWYPITESSEWRLVIATPAIDRAGPIAAYTRVQRVLATISLSHLTFTDITLMSPLGEDYKALHTYLSSPHRVGLTTGRVGGVIIEDAYIYQL